MAKEQITFKLVSLVCTAVVIGISAIVFLFTNFQTKDSAANASQVEEQRHGSLDKRLERIESKIDILLLRRK